MGEVKRIFLSPRRLALTAVITVLSVAFFFLGQMEYFGNGSLAAMVGGERYYAWLVQKTGDMDAQERDDFLAREDQLIMDYQYLTRWNFQVEGDPDEIRAEIAQRPYFRGFEALDALQAAWRVSVAQKRISELRNDSTYLEGYGAYLDQVQRQAQLQSQTALFGAEGSFSRRNLAKTAKEFDTLRDVEVSYGSNRGLTQWVNYEVADYLYLAFLCVFVLAFLEERRAGLWDMVRATRGGGTRLWVRRVLILAGAATLGTVLVYGINLVVSLALTGGFEDLGRSVQSMPVFRTLTLHLTLGQWIWLYLGVKTVSGFLVGLILWCVLGSLANVQFSIAVLGVTLGVEYALFALLPVQSILNPLKYFNLFSYIRVSKLYTDYLNIDLYSHPFGIRRLALTALPVLLVLFLLWSFLQQRNRRPQGNRDLLGILAGGWDRAADALRRHLSLSGWEVYKTLVFQRGILILIVIFIASGSLSYFRVAGSIDPSQDAWYRAYLEDLTGPVSGDLTEYFSIARENAGNDAQRLSSIDRVEAHVEEVRQKAAEGGYEPWIASSVVYEMAYGPASEDAQHVSAAAAMVFLILCTAAMGAFERQSGAVDLLRSTKRGRTGFIARKLLTLLIPTALVWGFVFLREQWQFLSYFHPSTLAAPIGNFEELERFPLNITIGQFMDLIYAMRFVMLYLTAAEVLFISQHLRSTLPAYAVTFAILGAPALLYALGVDAMGYISPAKAVSAAEIVWGLAATGGVTPLFPLLIWLAVGIAAVIADLRSWRS